MKLGGAVPVLRAFDRELARQFYVDWLGFRVDWEHQTNAPSGPWYWQISRDGTVLHLSEHHGDSTPGGKVIVAADDVDGYQDELRLRPNPFINPGVELMPWGAKVMQVTDPFGNRVCFSQAV